jgi:peroxiredoxin
MNRIKAFLLTVVVLQLMSFSGGTSETVSDFRLKNTDGKIVSLKDYPNAKGFIIIFTCNHCPFAKLYPPRLNALHRKYAAANVPLIAICSTDTMVYTEDVYAKMIAKAKAEKFEYPYLCDGDQQVGKSFSAQKTPHAFVIWREKGQWTVKYSGAIDDNGEEPDKVKDHYVANAVDELLKGKAVSVKETKSIGCQIHYRR